MRETKSRKHSKLLCLPLKQLLPIGLKKDSSQNSNKPLYPPRVFFMNGQQLKHIKLLHDYRRIIKFYVTLLLISNGR